MGGATMATVQQGAKVKQGGMRSMPIHSNSTKVRPVLLQTELITPPPSRVTRNASDSFSHGDTGARGGGQGHCCFAELRLEV